MIKLLSFARYGAMVGVWMAAEVACGDAGFYYPELTPGLGAQATDTVTSTTEGMHDSDCDEMCTTDTDSAPPECGNGVRENDEICDDGDAIDGNGCNNDCMPSGGIRWLHEDITYAEQYRGVHALLFGHETSTILAVASLKTAGDEPSMWLRKFDGDGNEAPPWKLNASNIVTSALLDGEHLWLLGSDAQGSVAVASEYVFPQSSSKLEFVSNSIYDGDAFYDAARTSQGVIGIGERNQHAWIQSLSDPDVQEWPLEFPQQGVALGTALAVLEPSDDLVATSVAAGHPSIGRVTNQGQWVWSATESGQGAALGVAVLGNQQIVSVGYAVKAQVHVRMAISVYAESGALVLAAPLDFMDVLSEGESGQLEQVAVTANGDLIVAGRTKLEKPAWERSVLVARVSLAGSEPEILWVQKLEGFGGSSLRMLLAPGDVTVVSGTQAQSDRTGLWLATLNP